MDRGTEHEDGLYEEAVAAHAGALERLTRSYELDPEKRRDLLQEIHLALWRSFKGYAAQCSMRTWVYRVAHNVAASHVIKDRRTRLRGFLTLDDISTIPDKHDTEAIVDRQKTLDRIHVLIHRLDPLEREVILLYLEGLDAASIGEITGLSSGNVATRVHRIKKILTQRFRQGESS
jgi:RNA polymerase sigma-70 factor (ECF subfamily)